jgi:hypothetical protein
MTKNVVVYSDGTGQAGGVRPDQRLSNVYKLYRASRTGPESPIDPSHQVAYYDAGLGTDDDVPSAPVRFVRWLQKLLGSATGRGITRNITDCYEFILNTYEPGDRIFLIGFSRGAYTARCVAGVLSLCGIPTHDADGGPLPKGRSATRSIAEEGVRKVYEHGAGRKIADFADQRNELARRFRERYGSDIAGQPNAAPYFIGVFDTVASLGSKGVFRFLLVTALLLGLVIACAVTAWVLSWAFGWQFLRIFLIVVGLCLVALTYSALKATLHVIWKWPTKRQFRWHIAKWDMKNYDRRLSSAVNFARHAISIDEDRADFPRVQWGFRTHDYVPHPGEAGPF